ncbi:spermidine synthase [Marinimicrobium sp. C2-29]|uniref:spermidine synthase n=1 Tax=Marinimicrobium sp. C2-29 TaxID=3139825 RepID=UPI0031395CB2
MSILWYKQQDGQRYEVRRAGQSLRLYTNGVFHSQYNPAQPVAGTIWDLLSLPAFALAPGRPRRVLVLGVGGGAVIRQLNHFFSPDLIVGIELNPVHLILARRFFDVEEKNVCLLEADALAWVDAYRGPAFDLVIDDLFGDSQGEPERAVSADRNWSRALRRLLAPGGMLVMNFDSDAGLKQSALWSDPVLRRQWTDRQRFSTPRYANQIAVFYFGRPDWAAFEERLQSHPELDQRRSGCRLTYRRQRF